MVAPADKWTHLQASCHGPTLDTKTCRFALSGHIGADSIVFSEAYREPNRRFLAARDHWRATMPAELPEDDRDTLRGKFDAPVLVRQRYAAVDEWSTKLCHRSSPLRLAPPRYGNGQAVVTQLGVVEVVGAHPHADIIGHPPDLPRVVEYRRSMQRLSHRLAQALDAGHLVIVSGDLNYPDRPGPAWVPREVLGRLGLRTWTVGVDWVAWSPELVAVDKTVIGRDKTRQDHPWLSVTFTGFVRGE